MSYTFRNTEINNEKASIFETKSMLHLIGANENRKLIEYVTFDCFNDVSGIDKLGQQIWDIQSKNEANLNPKKIGRYLFTLFDNYLSKFYFKEFIFFCPKLKDSYKSNSSLSVYKSNNIVQKTLIKIKAGLTEEVVRVKGSEIDYTAEIDNFLSVVVITEDNATEVKYLQSIVKLKNKSLKDDAFYMDTFRQLRDIQSAKKNSCIENKSILQVLDVINFQRYLRISDIEIFVICKIIGCEIFNYKGIPLHFLVYINHLSLEDKQDLLQECNSNLSRCLFNKRANSEFWKVIEKAIDFLDNENTEIQKLDVEFVFSSSISDFVPKHSYLNELTIKYLISLILDAYI